MEENKDREAREKSKKERRDNYTSIREGDLLLIYFAKLRPYMRSSRTRYEAGGKHKVKNPISGENKTNMTKH